jgi:hypothetical protein
MIVEDMQCLSRRARQYGAADDYCCEPQKREIEIDAATETRTPSRQIADG